MKIKCLIFQGPIKYTYFLLNVSNLTGFEQMTYNFYQKQSLLIFPKFIAKKLTRNFRSIPS